MIDKLAEYVARNGIEFEENIRKKNDERFDFLQFDHKYYKYYKITIFKIKRDRVANEKKAKQNSLIYKLKDEETISAAAATTKPLTPPRANSSEKNDNNNSDDIKEKDVKSQVMIGGDGEFPVSEKSRKKTKKSYSQWRNLWNC